MCSPGHKSFSSGGSSFNFIYSTLAETTLASGVVSSGVAFLRQWP